MGSTPTRPTIFDEKPQETKLPGVYLYEAFIYIFLSHKPIHDIQSNNDVRSRLTQRATIAPILCFCGALGFASASTEIAITKQFQINKRTPSEAGTMREKKISIKRAASIDAALVTM